MKAIIWGSRGSIPSSYSSDTIQRKVKKVLKEAIAQNINDENQIEDFLKSLPFALHSSYGSNTSCVQIIGGDEIIICDSGSGIRDFGTKLVQMGGGMPKKINIIMSHLHWDHIQGFPFFIPAYFQGVVINVWGCHNNIEDTFIRQQNEPTFPVQLLDMGAEINFHLWDKNKSYNLGGIDVDIIEQPHPGVSYGYKFSKSGKSIVYSTDAEHTEESQSDNYPFLKFIQDADVLIFDGQFNLADHMFTKQNWGHSSNLIGIELAIRAGVKKLCLFHSDHTFDDFQLDKFLENSLRYKEIYEDSAELEIMIAYDGLELVAE